ncbi:MAG: acyl--CoA ligase [Deltaproteobacteria bacterium]|jgi:acyl-CoA synthetase (AMP-forming)/AMP-acid ligase II|nr:acyl--CoA ligase [Deltaproteobacteria bacterium]MBW2499120.1 acyl--CoA ligase [Deltaproteobacteria bacterium]
MSIPEARTFWELLEERVALTPDALMLIDEHDAAITFADYRTCALSAASDLAEEGIGAGSRTSFQLPTRIATIVLMGALARLGAIQNPIVPVYREHETAFCLDETQAELLIVPDADWRLDEAEVRARATRPFRLLRVSSDPARLLGQDRERLERDLPPPPADPDAVRWIYYTSGTTSRPKGARQTDHAVALTAAGLVARHRITAADRFGMAFPFTHVGGLINLLATFLAGHPLVLLEAFEPERATKHFAKHSVSIVGGGPVFYAAILEEQRRRPDRRVLPSFRAFSGGGAPMNAELHYEVLRAMGGRGCLHGFGMTECGIICTNDVDDADDRLAETEGRPIPGVELRIVRLGGGLACTGEEGEVQLRGPAICRGYVDPAATAAAFDAEGWFRTGDLGLLDESGYLRITGRLKDVIIRKGESLSAVEIEDILYAHPRVADVAVIGLPDPTRGELVCAVVTARPGEPPIGFDEMVEYFSSAHVMAQKIPERLEVVDAIPRNPTGKILKQALRAQFA